MLCMKVHTWSISSREKVYYLYIITVSKLRDALYSEVLLYFRAFSCLTTNL